MRAAFLNLFVRAIRALHIGIEANIDCHGKYSVAVGTAEVVLSPGTSGFVNYRNRATRHAPAPRRTHVRERFEALYRHFAVLSAAAETAGLCCSPPQSSGASCEQC